MIAAIYAPKKIINEVTMAQKAGEFLSIRENPSSIAVESLSLKENFNNMSKEFTCCSRKEAIGPFPSCP